MAAMAAFTFSSCEDVPEPYTMPTKPDTNGTTEGEPTGTGTADDPFNSVAAINYCNTLEAGVESDKEVYIKGKVVSIYLVKSAVEVTKSQPFLLGYPFTSKSVHIFPLVET